MASMSRRRIGSGTKTSRARDGITFFGHSFIADPFGRYLAEAGEGEEILIARCDPGADRGRCAAQLAVPPRPAHRRLRADPQQVSRRRDARRRPTLRMPAEWEPHRATWICWPHHEPDWPGKFGAIPWVYAEIARVLADHEPVEILCPARRCSPTPARRSTRTASAATARACTWFRPTASGSAIRRRSACTMWAATSCCSRGRSTAGRSTTTGGRTPSSRVPIAAHHRDTVSKSRAAPTRDDGSCSKAAASTSTAAGLMLVTEEWLLTDTQVRNPGLTREDYEEIFSKWLGISRTHLAGRRMRRRRHARPRRRHRPIRHRRHRRAGGRGRSAR